MNEAQARERLARIHANLRFDHGSLLEETEEQLMVVAHLDRASRVLELGGNVGRNSCVIASLLNDSANLVVFESDPDNAILLQSNKDANGFRFAIEACALSRRPLIQHHWETRAYEGILPHDWKFVKTMPWSDVVAKHGSFDALVCDCEGALYNILVDEPEFAKGFGMIIIENDFFDGEHKQFVDEKFREAGLTRVFSKAGGWGPCANNFYEVWKLDC